MNRSIAILLVDDSLDERRKMAGLLEEAGYNSVVAEASDGREALDQLKLFKKTQLVITKLGDMPGMGGADFLICMNRRELCHIPYVVVMDEVPELMPLFHEHSGRLVKPFTSSELDEAIRNALHGSTEPQHRITPTPCKP
ncbi:MAG: response regulator [Candidatus Aenigmatarchaeota archaeon]|nr:response regulator [Nanoarchaeota archaeon]